MEGCFRINFISLKKDSKWTSQLLVHEIKQSDCPSWGFFLIQFIHIHTHTHTHIYMYLIIKCQLVLPKIQFLNYINFKYWTWGESGSVPKGTRYTNISYWLSLCVWFPELLFFHFWNSYSEMCILLWNHFLNTIKKIPVDSLGVSCRHCTFAEKLTIK